MARILPNVLTRPQRQWMGSVARVCRDGREDVFYDGQTLAGQWSMMKELTLLLLTFYMGAAPVFAQEAQADSSRSERPVFSMTPS